MIEFCSTKRMILSVVVLGILTILVLIFEEVLTSELLLTDNVYIQNTTKTSSAEEERRLLDPNPSAPSNVENLLSESKKRTCWLYEPFTIAQECSYCTDFEISSKTLPACIETGMKETIHCTISGTVIRSCSRVLGPEKQRFWIFQSLVLLLLVISYGVVRLRWSQLERRTVKAIERRLAVGH